MKKVKAFIEIGDDNTYSVYVDLDDNTLNYGIHGNGNSVKEAIADFLSAYKAMKDFFVIKNEIFTEANFEFHYDVASFLSYYKNIITLAGLERLTGINRGQLSHYATGRSKPTPKTTQKIENALHSFANELNQITFTKQYSQVS